ncbi:Na(+)/H(+) exchange regulatory cofactor NHE-RF1-like [Pollicipes pollicipes]|uniref:Na(+)/H(+) exchange regulatory cofactor NHE-RF1-like n=1 Tax=Pollicipes pollicipes TaxID=41117 RepID=UPI001884B86E|nr:Na(+)/H(+) exchange regulatory cofactor NHE-RF1-like [Pollicipes pollicipes]
MGRKDSLPEDAPSPRLCQLVKWPHFQGYGFNLHSEKGKEGQFIGKIDPASPAEACGLLEGDQIIEVNGVNTSNENHKQVVERIKADPDRVGLLVVDAKTAEYYKKRGVVVKGSLATVRHVKSQPAGRDLETGESDNTSQTPLSIEDSLTLAAQGCGNETPPPPLPPKTDLSLEMDEPGAAPALPADDASSTETSELTASEPAPSEPAPTKPTSSEPAPTEPTSSETAPTEPTASEPAPTEPDSSEPAELSKSAEVEQKLSAAENGKSTPTEEAEEKETDGVKDEPASIDTSLQVEMGPERTQPSPAPSAGSTGTVESAKSAGSGPAAAEGDKFGLKLNMTAAEMREYLKSKKRHDPRNDNLSFKRRHEIVSNM